MFWIVKDHFKGKVYLRTTNQSFAVDYANYYNNRKKVPFTNIKISFATSLMKSKYDIDINKQFGKRFLFQFYPSKFISPFVKDNKRYSKLHFEYLQKKYDLVINLCKKYHLWAYYELDGHKLCGFDW